MGALGGDPGGTVFVCGACGASSPKWQGRCDACLEWNTLTEERARAPRRRSAEPAPVAVRLGGIDRGRTRRLPTGLAEVDRVLGGGLVDGSLVLLGGDPGIGKSTLALQLAHGIGSAPAPSLYCAGEESPSQLAMRAERMGCFDERIVVSDEMSLPGCIAVIEATHPPIAVVDSVQTLHDPDAPGHPGSPSQVRAAVTRLLECAKRSGIPILLVGHVTKEGAIAGPRTLEHMVDVVLYLEGDRHGEHRLLRGLKNRFGATGELGIFQLGGTGMTEVGSAGRAFLEEGSLAIPGNVLTVTSEGSRALVVEVQALTVASSQAMPRRTAWGFDLPRLQLLVAVLQKRARLPLGERDVYLNCVGGVRLTEPGVDLAAAMAVQGAEINAAADPGTVVIGEVGLGGEIRRVRHLDARLAEAAAVGIRRAIIPAGQESRVPGIRCHQVGSLLETLDLLSPAGERERVARPARSTRPTPSWVLRRSETVA
jgi:DNA repair protein RadA/Sms